MKQIIKITILMIVALTFLAACQTKEDITSPATKLEVGQRMSGDAQMSYQAVANDISLPIKLPLMSNKNVEAGYILVSNNQKNLYVTYYLNSNWQLSQSYLNVSGSAAGIPRDAMGVPLPKDFNYPSTLNRCEQVFTRVIPLKDLNLKPGDNFVVASQAIVASKTSGGISNKPVFSVCVPGKADAQWWLVASGKLNDDPNIPDTELPLTLNKLITEQGNI